MSSHFRETHVPFSQKHCMKFYCFQKNVIIFQSKASTETRITVLAFFKSVTYPIKRLIYSEKGRCISPKIISWNSYLQKNMIIFQSKFTTQTRNTVLIRTILWHITNHVFSFQRNTCVFLTKAFHEILLLSKEHDYLSK